MTREELFRAVGEVREDQITEAETMKKKSRPWRRYGAMAACAAVVLGGVFALGRQENTWRWAEIMESFRPAIAVTVSPESASDAGGGAEDEDVWHKKTGELHPEEQMEDGVSLDGAEYWMESGKRPAPGCSVNVEIGELRRESGADGENRTGMGMASCLAWLSPEEIFAQDTAIFRGTVRALRYYVVEAGGHETQYTAADVEVTDVIRGEPAAGETRTVLYPGGPDMTTSISGPLDDLKVGSDAVFMPVAATPETGAQSGGSYFCYADLGDFYLSEGQRFVFLDTGEGLDFERGTYEEIADAETLDEVAAYIRRMTEGTEQSRPAAVPAEPQAALAETGSALLDPGYGVEGPSGAREADLMICG